MVGGAHRTVHGKDTISATQSKRLAHASARKLTPLDVVVDFVIEFTDTNLDRMTVFDGPAEYRTFSHYMLCSEMFLVLIEQLNSLVETDLSDLGDFSSNATVCCARAKAKMADLRAEAPNTFRACHTLLGFNIVAGEFRRAVRAYLDEGFFTEELVAAADFVMQGRQQELAQYFLGSPILMSLFQSEGHPIFNVYELDQMETRRLLRGSSSESPASLVP